LQVEGLEVRGKGLGLRAQVLRFGVWGLGLRMSVLVLGGSMFEGLRLRINN